MAYFLAKEAKDVYQAEDPGALDSRNALEATWPYATNALIRRFLADDILQSAYDAVLRATQGASEDEIKFAQRITDAARECCHVLQSMELVNIYVRGLQQATLERIQEQVRRLPSRNVLTSWLSVRSPQPKAGRSALCCALKQSDLEEFVRGTEIFQEGVRIPPLKLYDRGESNETLWKLLETNIRIPVQVFGDLRAQLAACSIAENQFTELVDEYGIEPTRHYMNEVMNYAERLTRSAISERNRKFCAAFTCRLMIPSSL